MNYDTILHISTPYDVESLPSWYVNTVPKVGDSYSVIFTDRNLRVKGIIISVSWSCIVREIEGISHVTIELEENMTLDKIK